MEREARWWEEVGVESRFGSLIGENWVHRNKVAIIREGDVWREVEVWRAVGGRCAGGGPVEFGAASCEGGGDELELWEQGWEVAIHDDEAVVEGV